MTCQGAVGVERRVVSDNAATNGGQWRSALGRCWQRRALEAD